MATNIQDWVLVSAIFEKQQQRRQQQPFNTTHFQLVLFALASLCVSLLPTSKATCPSLTTEQWRRLRKWNIVHTENSCAHSNPKYTRTPSNRQLKHTGKLTNIHMRAYMQTHAQTIQVYEHSYSHRHRHWHTSAFHSIHL